LPHPAPSTHGLPLAQEATIDALAQETDTDQFLVKCLYDEEIARLEAQATVTNFIGVIATRRVRQRLTAARRHGRLDRRSGTPVTAPADSGTETSERRQPEPRKRNARVA
jgi:hypothetical protein